MYRLWPVEITPCWHLLGAGPGGTDRRHTQLIACDPNRDQCSVHDKAAGDQCVCTVRSPNERSHPFPASPRELHHLPLLCPTLTPDNTPLTTSLPDSGRLAFHLHQPWLQRQTKAAWRLSGRAAARRAGSRLASLIHLAAMRGWETDARPGWKAGGQGWG